MVEAVVSNGDTEGAYELIHQMQDDEQCRGVLNSVIYCSVLKGFAREKRLERVWSVYQEMQTHDVDVSVVTYNTILDACVRCGSMEWVDGILADMTEQSCPLNLITYSTIVKGHCQKGDLQTALALVERMRSETKLKPDEIMYNSLLDGCAQAGLQDEGQRLLRQMQKEGVAPSNFTLSIMVKLMSRARKLDAAFALVEEISTKYRFRPNVHVITNLIQACVSNRQLKRGVDTWEAMVADRVQPEPRTYAVLLRACLQQNRLDTVEALLRGALGLEGSSRSAFCGNVDSALVNEALVGLGERGGADTAMGILAEMKRRGSRVRIDAVTQRRLVQASSGIAASPHLPAGPTRRDRRGQS
jgi:pentatricopeptide repeat protein